MANQPTKDGSLVIPEDPYKVFEILKPNYLDIEFKVLADSEFDQCYVKDHGPNHEEVDISTVGGFAARWPATDEPGKIVIRDTEYTQVFISHEIGHIVLGEVFGAVVPWVDLSERLASIWGILRLGEKFGALQTKTHFLDHVHHLQQGQGDAIVSMGGVPAEVLLSDCFSKHGGSIHMKMVSDAFIKYLLEVNLAERFIDYLKCIGTDQEYIEEKYKDEFLIYLLGPLDYRKTWYDTIVYPNWYERMVCKNEHPKNNN